MRDHKNENEVDSRRRGRSARLIGAAMLAGAIIVGAGCGAAPSDVRPEPAGAVVAGGVKAGTMSGSDRHLEMHAKEIADAWRPALCPVRTATSKCMPRRSHGVEAGTMSGSDRHLEMHAKEIARVEAGTVSGSDRHLEMHRRKSPPAAAPQRVRDRHPRLNNSERHVRTGVAPHDGRGDCPTTGPS